MTSTPLICEQCGACCKPYFEGNNVRTMIIDHEDQRAIARFLGLRVSELSEQYRVNREAQSLDVSRAACPFLEEPKPYDEIVADFREDRDLKKFETARKHHCKIYEVRPKSCQRWPTEGTKRCVHSRARTANDCPAMAKWLSNELARVEFELEQTEKEFAEWREHVAAEKERSK